MVNKECIRCDICPGHVQETSVNLANCKTISYDKNGERLLVYDSYKQEVFNIQTGEVI